MTHLPNWALVDLSPLPGWWWWWGVGLGEGLNPLPPRQRYNRGQCEFFLAFKKGAAVALRAPGD